MFFLAADQMHAYNYMCGEAGVSLLLGRDALPLVNAQLAEDFEFGLFNRYRRVPYCDVPPEAEDELRDLLDRIGREQTTGKFLDAHWDCLAAHLTLFSCFSGGTVFGRTARSLKVKNNCTRFTAFSNCWSSTTRRRLK